MQSKENLQTYRKTVPRRSPLDRFPRLGDLSRPSLTPQTVEPSGPPFLQSCTRPSRGPHRSLAVVPLIGDKRYYGEAPVRLRGAILV